MDLNLDALSEAQLVALNHRIAARLNFLQQARSHLAMLDIRIGERVSFQPPGEPPLFGLLTRYNRKSVTVITEDGRQWTVAPTLLRKVADGAVRPDRRPRAGQATDDIIELRSPKS